MSSYAASMKCSGKAALHVRSTCLVPSVSHEGADWSQWRGVGVGILRFPGSVEGPRPTAGSGSAGIFLVALCKVRA